MTAPKETFVEYKFFGSALKEAREAQGLSQTQLGEIFELARSSIASIESGKQGVYLRQAIQMANLLGFSLSAIQTDLADRESTRELRQKLLDLKKRDVDAALNLVKEKNKEYEIAKRAFQL
jgi:transcriptional regulator with XRE-family HTH domain